MTVTVRYRRIEGYQRSPINQVMAPLVAVRIAFSGRAVDTLGLVDSGADVATFNDAWAQPLGIDLTKYPTGSSTGIGGGGTSRHVPVMLTACGKRFSATVSFSPLAPTPFGLLGRADFFEAFNVGFDQRNYQLLVQPLP